ncbi:RNA binding motif protein 12Ba [Tachysurus fulvidraco]|uniref:RNA binding motif protein 12Ba n=1 Tax=Tachysurus fulvidraco TaxID=1234273 RepID=UPI000F4EB1F7|nr:RNA binding motif protein 12Ba [Tachysurus fulvidraco]
MAVVLRLQGLNIEAGHEDIRKFFHGLSIPKGCVHITGGKTGEAFIIFSSERAGQLAMLHSGKPLKGSTVTLYKSSMAEFKHKMELKLRKRKCASVEREPVLQITATEMYKTLLYLGAAVQGLQSKVQSPPVSPTPSTDVLKLSKDAIDESPIAYQTQPVQNQVADPRKHHVEEQHGGVRDVSSCKPGYLRLYGLPNTITKEEVCQFLEGLRVVDVITDTLQRQDQCCLVKMASFKEAEEGLNYSCRSPRDFPVEVRLAHERMWESAMEHRENSLSSILSEQDRSSPDRRLQKNSLGKRPDSFWSSPKRRRSNSPSFNTEYYVMVRNLPKTFTKSEIRHLFSCPDIPNSKILHLLNKWKERTSTAFIIFTQPEDYTLAMNMNGTTVCSHTIDVSSITKEKMKDLMSHNRCTDLERPQTFSSNLSHPSARGIPPLT